MKRHLIHALNLRFLKGNVNTYHTVQKTAALNPDPGGNSLESLTCQTQYMFTKYSVGVECQHNQGIRKVPWKILQAFGYATN